VKEGEFMDPVPILEPVSNSPLEPSAKPAESVDWVEIAAGGSLIVGGFLLLTGQRRAGMIAAASGTALALLSQQDTLSSWWRVLPGYVDQVQRMIGQVQGRVEAMAAKRESLQQVLVKSADEG
jgi:hypothetical protein